jgi:hypothetical protein
MISHLTGNDIPAGGISREACLSPTANSDMGGSIYAEQCAGALGVHMEMSASAIGTRSSQVHFQENLIHKLSLDQLSVQDILAEIANRLEELLDLLAEKGFGPLKETYLRSWHHTGQNVSFPP